MAAVLRPADRRAAVDVVLDGRVGAEFEQRLDSLCLARMRGEMQGGHALAMVGATEGSARVHVGAKFDEAANRRYAPVAGRPGERRTTVRVGVGISTKLDEPLDHLDTVALRRPDERLVEDLLRIVGGLPGGEAAVRTVEASVRARRGRAAELVDQVDESEPSGDAQVARLEPEQIDDLAMTPEERHDERRAAVAAREE